MNRSMLVVAVLSTAALSACVGGSPAGIGVAQSGLQVDKGCVNGQVPRTVTLWDDMNGRVCLDGSAESATIQGAWFSPGATRWVRLDENAGGGKSGDIWGGTISCCHVAWSDMAINHALFATCGMYTCTWDTLIVN